MKRYGYDERDDDPLQAWEDSLTPLQGWLFVAWYTIAFAIAMFLVFLQGQS